MKANVKYAPPERHARGKGKKAEFVFGEAELMES